MYNITKARIVLKLQLLADLIFKIKHIRESYDDSSS